MGEVYLGEAPGAANFSKQVAIKCILPHLAKNTDFVQKFIDEANLMVQLQHGSIVPIIELFEEEGLLYLVMEYVPGRDLKAVLRQTKRTRHFAPKAVCLWIVQQLCDALTYAHEKRDSAGEPLGIIHRDVTPSNIILGESGEVKLLDFGIAKARSRVHQSISGTLQGKFIYMSPEQADGRPIDHRSDVFSLGLILYELLTHVRPFEGDGEPEILRNARECQISPPSLYRPELDAALDTLVLKALGKAPDERYRSAFDFRQSLSEYIAQNALHPSPSGLVKFLNHTFPDGVVDNRVGDVHSMDEALLQQINNLTPSYADPIRSTVTKDETLTMLPNPMPMSSNALAPLGDPAERKTENVGSRQAWLLGGLLSALLLAAFFGGNPLEMQETPALSSVETTVTKSSTTGVPNNGANVDQEKRAQFEFSFIGPQRDQVTLTVDDAPHGFDMSLPVGRTYLICASAAGFKKTCKRTILEKTKQSVAFQLARHPTLRPVVVGIKDQYEITVNDVIESSFPMFLESGKSYRVCGRSPLATNSPYCVRIDASDGQHAPELILQPKAATKRSAIAAAPSQQPISKTLKPSVISSIPTADVFQNGLRLGTTPFTVPNKMRGKSLQLRAKGYVNTNFAVPKKPGQSYRVNLKRPGYLSVRVSPPASRIFIDGIQAGTGYLKRFPLAPGKRKLEAIFASSNGQENRWGPTYVNVVAGQEKRLEQIIVRRTRSTTP